MSSIWFKLRPEGEEIHVIEAVFRTVSNMIDKDLVEEYDKIRESGCVLPYVEVKNRIDTELYTRVYAEHNNMPPSWVNDLGALIEEIMYERNERMMQVLDLAFDETKRLASQIITEYMDKNDKHGYKCVDQLIREIDAMQKEIMYDVSRAFPHLSQYY